MYRITKFAGILFEKMNTDDLPDHLFGFLKSFLKAIVFLP